MMIIDHLGGIDTSSGFIFRSDEIHQEFMIVK